MSRKTRQALNGRHVGALVCLCGASTLYLLTMAPTVQGFDSAELTTGAFTLGFVHAPGYPLYMLLGHLFAKIPIGNVGLRLNLMSAIFGTLSALVLYELLLTQTQEWIASLLATSLFATAPIFWSQATRAEVYTLHTFLMVSTLLAWLRAHRTTRMGGYVVCFILMGIGIGNHLTTVLLWASVLASTIWNTPRYRRIGIGATLLGIAIAAACYSYFPWRSRDTLRVDYIRPYFDVDPGSLSGIWWLISGQAFRRSFYLDFTPISLLQEIRRLSVFVWDGSLGIGLILGAWGWRSLRQAYPLWNRLLSLYLLVNVVGFVSYHVVDKEAMFLPMYIVGSIWVASGANELRSWIKSHLPKSNPARIQTLVNLTLFLVVAIGAWLNWSSVDLSNNSRVYHFADQLLDEVEYSTMIVNHWVTASVVDYLQVVEERRPDVVSFNLSFYFLGLQMEYDSLEDVSARAAWFSWLDNHLGRRPLCFIEPLPLIPSNFSWIKQGSCWKIVTTGVEN
jgi:hypothetical protein